MIYIKFPYGTIEETPPFFKAPEEWPEYSTISDPVPIAKREEVGTNPHGKRWVVWPLCFEEYVSDQEPDLEESKKGIYAYNRLITWKRVSRQDKPKGWWEPTKINWRVDGYHQFVPDEEYTKRWSKDARYELRVWKERHAQHYSIEQVSFTEYEAAYRQSLIATRVNTDRLEDLERKLQYPGAAAHTTLWGVRNAAGTIIAGTGLIHSPTFKCSAHYAPFILAEGAKVHAATALMDHWFSLAQKRGDTYVMTTNFWYPSQPKSWKGFSEFKSHFGWRYMAYPPMLIRLVRGKLF